MIRRLLFIALAFLAAPAWGATYYVDGGCGTAGNGTSATCLTSPTTNNPKVDIPAGIALMAAGDTLNVRGIHGAHDNCPGLADGRYFGNEYAITLTCNGGAPCVLQSYGWTVPGTGEKVFIDGTRPTSAGWTVCTWDGSACDCDANHQNVQIGGGGSTACGETWWTTDNGTAPAGFQSGSAAEVRFAQKDDGSITYRVASLAAMTNATAGYNASRCSVSAWAPCTVNGDCASGETCTASSPERDSFRDSGFSPNVLFARWVSLPSKPYVSYTGAGDAFAFKSSGPAAFWTMRGFTMRAHKVASVFLDQATVNNITFDDTRSFFNQCGLDCDGSSRAFTVVAPQALTIQNSEMAFSADEGIHADGRTGGAATMSILKNWIHGQGYDKATGAMNGTPSGILVGDDTANDLKNDWTGAVIQGNLIVDQKKSSGSPGYGIRMEHAVSHMDVSGNYIKNNRTDANGAPCLTLDGSSGGTGTSWTSTDNRIYNNILDGCLTFGINVFCSATVTNNLIFNNTVVNSNSLSTEFNLENGTGTCTGNIFRNNLVYDDGAKQVVALGFAGTTNKWQNNLTYSTAAGTVVAFAGKNSTCAQIVVGADVDNDTVANDNDKCADPLFVSTTDFHIQSASPAKDAGTATGMPAGRTTDICNPLAVLHGLPNYNDCQGIQGGTWDIGADEYVAAGTRRLMVITKWRMSAPEIER